jgi:hypothetical protein
MISIDLVGWESDEQYDRAFEVLWLISKESFATLGGPETWMARKRLDDTLRRTLVDPGSPEIKVLRKRLQERDIPASPDELARWFSAALENPPYQLPTPTARLATGDAPAHSGLADLGSSPSPVVGQPRLGRTGGPLFLLTPVKDEDEATAKETLERLLGSGLYVFGEHTAGRAALKAGDRICFYHSGVGIVADAEIASVATKNRIELSRHPERYPWMFSVRSVRMYFDAPIILSAALRASLDAFAKNDPNGNWAWFVQGTHYLTEHDFALLTAATR